MATLVFAAIASSCSSDDAVDGVDSSVEATAIQVIVETTISRAVEAGSVLPDISLIGAFPDLDRRLTGSMPLQVVPVPGKEGVLAIVDQLGLITTVDSQLETPTADTLLDISDRVSTRGDEEGLLGLAFDPAFDSNSEFYVYYSATNPRRTVLSRFTGSVNTAETEEELMEIEQPFANHNGGAMAFGPDGMLYLGLGDGGSGGDPRGNGQDRSTLLGSVLRIDVMSTESSYVIPADNPFTSESGARGEIWAYGFRNPWRFSFDSETGGFWLADVGQNEVEEIDLVVKGGNYGWNEFEGSRCFDSPSCDRTGFEMPVFEYGRSDGCSITGGHVYRGEAIPELTGAYVYSDFCSGRIWALRYDGDEVVEQRQIGQAPSFVSSFGVDHDGELYVTTFGEGVLRIVSGE